MAETVLNAPVSRIDGPLKVTGGAKYAGDHTFENLAHAHLIVSPVAKGRVVSIDSAAARKVPGVVTVFDHTNIPAYKAIPSIFDMPPFAHFGYSSFWALQSDAVNFWGQPVAVVIADSIEAAREAAALVKVEIAADSDAVVDLKKGKPDAVVPLKPLAVDHGDVEAGVRDAAAVVDEVYETPVQHHNPIELFSATAQWTGDDLLMRSPTQGVTTLQAGLAEMFGLPMTNVRVLSEYVGGGFGSKGQIAIYHALAAAAAKGVGRPVKLVVTREQMFALCAYRSQTVQRVRLAAKADGMLTAFEHESRQQTSHFDTYMLPQTHVTPAMYQSPAIRTREEVVKVDTITPAYMRAPGETPSFFALESAIDELAYKLNIDPVELRIMNDTKQHPVKGAPFSSRSLVECLRRGAHSFGWSQRNSQPGSMKAEDGSLVGYGCAIATYPTQMSPSSARVRLTRGGRIEVELAAHDLGTGAYTVMAQIAASHFGVPVSEVSVKMGDSSLPFAPLAGGSVTTASAGSAVVVACQKVKKELAARLTTLAQGPFIDKAADAVQFTNGMVTLEGTQQPLAEAVASIPEGYIEMRGDWVHPDAKASDVAQAYKGGFAAFGPFTEKASMCSFGAQFVEVRIHPRTKEIRVPRMVGAFAAGNILNTKTGHSQLMGGMIWGVSAALHEATEIDQARARFINTNIAEYLIPVNADIGEVTVELVPEEDTYINLLGVKGIGELGIVGVNAAIANAVFHATGQRLRRLPIRLADLHGVSA